MKENIIGGILDILYWASWTDYIRYIGLTPYVDTQCGTISIFSNTTAPVPIHQLRMLPSPSPVLSYALASTIGLLFMMASTSAGTTTVTHSLMGSSIGALASRERSRNRSSSRRAS